MTLYLLDKNIVEDIRGSLKGIRSPHIRFAREIDRKPNTVSPLLSIVEGSARTPQSASEIHDSMIRDVQAVSMFYSQANTDSAALTRLGPEMAITFGAHVREKSLRLMPLASELQKLLARTYSTIDARRVLQEIESLAQENSVELAHPLVSCAIGCLYGHSGARDVLKTGLNGSEGDSYNTVLDIRLLMEAAYIRQMWQQDRPWQQVRIRTRDKGLNRLAADLAVVATGSTSLPGLELELINYTSTLSEALFPNLAREPRELERVMSRMRDGRQDTSLWKP